MENIFCDLCKSKKYRVFLTKIKSPEFDEEFTLVKCIRCGLVYLNPRPTRSHIHKYYETTNYYSNSSDAVGVYSHLYKIVFEKVKSGKVLDIGAGTGLFLTELKKRGWDVYGIEPTDVGRRIAKTKFGTNLKKGDVSDINFKNNYFDLVVLNNVIEHLHKPQNALKKVSKIIKKGGFVLISCPNIDGVGPFLFKRRWYGVDAPRHLYQFNPETLGKLLKRSGFKIVRISHSFYRHNYMILFESFRRSLSPKFSEAQKRLAGSPPVKENSKQSLVKQIGVIVCKVLSGVIAVVEPLIGRGEIITVLATKTT